MLDSDTHYQGMTRSSAAPIVAHPLHCQFGLCRMDH